jgi:hypothetical protein
MDKPASAADQHRLVGATPVTAEPRLQVTAADRAEAAAALAADDRPLVVLHPGANDPRRRWPVERLAAVSSELARQEARLAVVGTAPSSRWPTGYWPPSKGTRSIALLPSSTVETDGRERARGVNGIDKASGSSDPRHVIPDTES